MIHLTNRLKKIAKHTFTKSFFSTGKQENDSQKVFIDEESIKKKMKELK
jgi:hypothetical protein